MPNNHIANYGSLMKLPWSLFSCAMFLSFFLGPARGTSLIADPQGQKTAASQENVRECVPGFAETSSKKKTGSSRKKEKDLTSPVSCIEVRGGALAVQEYLQKAVWEFHWTLNDEQASEELWSFSMGLSAEDLLNYVKPFSDPKIDWRGGRSVVNVRTTELQDGFARVIVTAKFEGYGVPEDKFAPKRESWPLPSSGTLEAKIANAVRDRFKTGH